MRLCGHKYTLPVFCMDLGGGVHRKHKPNRVWVMWDLEQNISYCSGGKSKSADKFNSQQDMLCYGVYMWEIKETEKMKLLQTASLSD